MISYKQIINKQPTYFTHSKIQHRHDITYFYQKIVKINKTKLTNSTTRSSAAATKPIEQRSRVKHYLCSKTETQFQCSFYNQSSFNLKLKTLNEQMDSELRTEKDERSEAQSAVPQNRAKLENGLNRVSVAAVAQSGRECLRSETKAQNRL